MPQASDELRSLMKLWFGDATDERGPYDLLIAHGFTEQGNGMMCKPTPSHSFSYIEWHCIKFLINEWDFGLYSEGPIDID